jgi:hypothetical protein
MGMFKDMFKLTKQANELKRSSGAPGVRDMLEQAPGRLQQGKIAIGWDAMGRAPERGEIRPA